MKFKIKRYYFYYLARVAIFIVSILPLCLGLRLADLAGKLIFAILRGERQKALGNLRASFPEKKDAEIEKIARDVFTNICKNAVEFVNIYKLNAKNIDSWIKIEGSEKIDRALLKGKGVIILASHLGNWELVTTCLNLSGYNGIIIARRIRFYKFNSFIEKVRKSKGVGIIYRDESPKKILRQLKQNGMIGILGDQDVDSVDGVFVNFFGRPAYTPKAPVAFALASGAALIPCFMIREKGHHKFIVEDPIELEKTPDKDQTIKVNTEKWSNLIESYIRRYPGQWVWMHRRWKTKPENKV